VKKTSKNYSEIKSHDKDMLTGLEINAEKFPICVSNCHLKELGLG
jgi:hypothetical protein